MKQDLGPRTISVLRNDELGDGIVRISALGAPNRGGSARIAGRGGRVRYQPAPGYAGVERFSYTISDGIVSSTAVVRVKVVPRVTIRQLQVEVFDGHGCLGCHSGPAGNSLPQGMDLSTAENSYASLVGVPSLQRPNLSRVEPGNPDASYLIHKLDGSDIIGQRMPMNGAPLDQAQMQRIRSWISDGAPLD